MSFHGYGFMIGVAIVVGWWWAERRAKQLDIKGADFNRAIYWAMGLGLVGARLYHVVDYQEYYLADPTKIIAVWQGGLGIFGAIAGGLLGLWVGGKGKNWEKLVGTVAAAMPLSQAIGRLGNWINGELYGVGGLPWFAIEAGLNLILFWGINFGIKERQPGKILAEYLIGYGLIRLMLEPLRVESWQLTGVPVATIMSIITIIGGALIWITKSKRA